MEMLKIKDTLEVFGFSVTDDKGIFYQLASYFDWMQEDEEYLFYDEYYYLNNGERLLSPVYKKILQHYTELGVLTPQLIAVSKIAEIVYQKFKDKWNKIHSSFINSTYNPIHNYDMQETEKQSSKVTTTGDVVDGNYGFDSDRSSPQTSSNAVSVVSGDSDDNKRELTRKGNIGVTTSQKMLSDEIELRRFNFLDEMIRDVNSVLTLKVMI